MQRLIRWSALAAGLAILLYCGAVFIEFARIMEPLGGIPYSWDLLRRNTGWAFLVGAGLILCLGGVYRFAKARRDSN